MIIVKFSINESDDQVFENLVWGRSIIDLWDAMIQIDDEPTLDPNFRQILRDAVQQYATDNDSRVTFEIVNVKVSLAPAWPGLPQEGRPVRPPARPLHKVG